MNRFEQWCEQTWLGRIFTVLLLLAVVFEIIWIGAASEAIFLPAPEYVITEVEE